MSGSPAAAADAATGAWVAGPDSVQVAQQVLAGLQGMLGRPGCCMARQKLQPQPGRPHIGSPGWATLPASPAAEQPGAQFSHPVPQGS